MRGKFASIVLLGLAIGTMEVAAAGAARPRTSPLRNAVLSVVARAEEQAPTSPKTLDGLDEFITGVMKDWKIPGLSLAVVQNGQVVFLKGYGYRDSDKKLPVTPH
ncbi:MAG: hypothetical protein DMG21_03375, partial [Acidobacteria bacterium]